MGTPPPPPPATLPPAPFLLRAAVPGCLCRSVNILVTGRSVSHRLAAGPVSWVQVADRCCAGIFLGEGGRGARCPRGVPILSLAPPWHRGGSVLNPGSPGVAGARWRWVRQSGWLWGGNSSHVCPSPAGEGVGDRADVTEETAPEERSQDPVPAPFAPVSSVFGAGPALPDPAKAETSAPWDSAAVNSGSNED